MERNFVERGMSLTSHHTALSCYHSHHSTNDSQNKALAEDGSNVKVSFYTLETSIPSLLLHSPSPTLSLVGDFLNFCPQSCIQNQSLPFSFVIMEVVLIFCQKQPFHLCSGFHLLQFPLILLTFSLNWSMWSMNVF